MLATTFHRTSTEWNYNPDHATWLPLLSHAMWNIWKGSNLQQSQSIATSYKGLHHPPKSWALPIQHLAPIVQSTGLTWTQTAGMAVHAPNHLPPAPLNPPKPSTTRSTNFTRAAILIYLFLAVQVRYMGPTKLLAPLILKYWCNQQPCLIHTGKSQKTCY